LSVVIGFLLLLATGKRDPFELSLYLLPTAFLILMIAVRIAPLVVKPTLVAGEPPGHVIKLNLDDAPPKK
jgi:hypothetical protein